MVSAARLRGDPSEVDTLHLVVVQIKSLPELEKAMDRVRSWGIDVHPFYESDIGDELTAFATGIVPAEQRRQFRRFQLWKGPATPVVA